jgi:1-acyl-sn-glycerol-3-phosphate acyltransferase
MLRETGAYQTPARSRRSIVQRVFGHFDWWFYVGALFIYASGYVKSLLGRYDDGGWAQSSYEFVRLYEACGARISISGALNLAHSQGPVVIVANHMSAAETYLLPCMALTFGRLAIVVKRSLTRYPMFGRILRKCDPIEVKRETARDDLRVVLKEGLRALQHGRSVLLFPQSTRDTRFEVKRFNSLGAKLADRAKVPIVPVALKTDFHGLGRMWKDWGKLDRTRPMHICFGPPLIIDSNEKEIHRNIIDFISKNLHSWECEVLDEGPL